MSLTSTAWRARALELGPRRGLTTTDPNPPRFGCVIAQGASWLLLAVQ